MTSETDLSTADLAQPGGSRQPDRAGDDRREARAAGDATGERTYETSGNRVAQDPADEDTVELGSARTTAGSTRDDAVRGGMPSAGADPGTAEEHATDQDTIDRDATDRDATDRDTADGGRGGGTADRGPGAGDTRGDVELLDPADAEGFRQRWSDTQARFVDDPRDAVQTADGLVAELMQTLASRFSQHRGELEAHWNSGGDPDTEDLRQALQHYRSFFDRLLSA